MANTPTTLPTDPRDDHARLDLVLCRHLHVSRAEAGRLLERGHVRLNGRRVGRGDKGLRLAPGDRVEVEPFDRADQQQPIPAPEAPLDVCAAGPGWLIVDKPAGAPVHPLEPTERGTVLNALIARHPGVQGVGEAGLRSGVVHRLDVETSGTLLFALTEPAWQRLRAAFREHRVRKRYLALVHGRWDGPGRRETMHLTIAQHRPARVRVVEPDAAHPARQTRRCTLAWRPVERFADATLIEVDLGTGFLHQIRAMCAHLGHPLVGDALYAEAREPNRLGAQRPMLHACSLAFEEVCGACDPPADFQGVLMRLRGAGGLLISDC